MTRKAKVKLRIQAANRAFYSLQGAGLNCCGVSPNTAIHIYSTAVRSCLTYGCSAVNISKTKIKELDKIQGKHIKCILGLKYNTRTTPLLEAINLSLVSKTVESMSLDLLRKCMVSDSQTHKFYFHMLRTSRKGQKKLIKNTLFHRTLLTCKNNNINLSNYVLDKHYAGRRKYLFNTKITSGQDGLIDTIRNCLLFYDSDKRTFLNILLKSF